MTLKSCSYGGIQNHAFVKPSQAHCHTDTLSVLHAMTVLLEHLTALLEYLNLEILF